MKALTIALLTIYIFSTPAKAGEYPSLNSFQGVTDVVVTSAHPGLSEEAVRQYVQGRLQERGLLIQSDGSGNVYLVVEISVVRRQDDSGRCSYTAYDNSITLKEKVTLMRAQEVDFDAVTWRTGTRVSVMGGEVPPLTVQQNVENLIGKFIQAVISARQFSQ